MHDFKLFETSIGYGIRKDILAQLDSGYQGILKLHANSETPKKKPKGGELTAEEKTENRRFPYMGSTGPLMNPLDVS